MKKTISILAAFLFIFTTLSLTSCSDSDGGGNFEEPKFEQDAARYEITSANSPYASIELTASGNYIIIEKNSSYAHSLSAKKKSFSFSKKEAKTRASSDGVIWGKYTKGANGEYILEGFGTIKVESKGDNAYDLDITKNNGSSVVVGANRDNKYSSSSKTDALCRSWGFDKIRAAFWLNGKKVYDETLNMKQIAGVTDEDSPFYELKDDLPELVIFTKAGTYMVIYSGNELAISTWRWENESKGILRYSWDYDHLYDPEESGTVTTSFSGSSLLITEEYEDEEDGDVVRGKIDYYLKENK